MQGLQGVEVHLGGFSIDDLEYRRLRDAMPNTSRAYNSTILAGQSFSYAGSGGYHAALFDFLADMGCHALTFVFTTDNDVEIQINGNTESIYRVNAHETFSLSRWELVVSRIQVRTAGTSPSSGANAVVRIFVSGWFAPTRTKQAGTV